MKTRSYHDKPYFIKHSVCKFLLDFTLNRYV